MLLIFVRHADAGERDPDKWPDDDLRPLSAQGRRKQSACARAMKSLEITADQIITSPLLRAVQTAEILAEVLGLDPADKNEALGNDCHPGGVVALAAKFDARSTIMLVGHEPSFSQVAAALIGKSGDARIELKKSGVIGIAFEGAPALGEGRLLYLLKASLFRKAKR